MANIGIVGLGHIGLPLAIEFDKSKHDVTGFDIDGGLIDMLNQNKDPRKQISEYEISNSNIIFSNKVSSIKNSHYIIITVPTPINSSGEPNTKLIESAGRMIGRYLMKGSTVVLESTVYPGATRGVLLPALEETSNMSAEDDFSIGYSPERYNPGNEGPGISNIAKIVSGLDNRTARNLEDLYKAIINAEIHRAPSIEVAETAKCLENVQRDVNIALMNELAIACTHLQIETQAVIDAAKTKWNFHEYNPGFVGGHCLPVDPYYYASGCEKQGYTPDLVRTARNVNETVPRFAANKIIEALKSEQNLKLQPVDGGRNSENERRLPERVNATVLIIGLAYKKNIADIRSPATKTFIDQLKRRGVDVVGYDPHIRTAALEDAFGIPIDSQFSPRGYDGIVATVAHEEFRRIDKEKMRQEMGENPVFLDIPGIFSREIMENAGFSYRRL